MKFFSKKALATAAILIAMPLFASAQNPLTAGVTAANADAHLTNVCGSGSATGCIADIIGKVIGAALGLVGVLLVCLFIYAGFLYMTAQGDPKQVETAKGMIFNAVGGVVIIGLSYVLASFVLSTLSSATSGGTSPTPAAGTQSQTTQTPVPPAPYQYPFICTCTCAFGRPPVVTPQETCEGCTADGCAGTCGQFTGTAGIGSQCDRNPQAP